MKIKVIIADDHKIFREGLKNLLNKDENIEIIAEADNGLDLVKLVKELKPNIVIADISMPQLNGIDAAKKILSLDSSVKIIALTMHSDKRFVFEMLKSGAKGYLLKDCAFDDLSNAIYAVNENKTYISPNIASVVVDGFVSVETQQDQSCYTILTEREREVLHHIADGKSMKEIASLYALSIKTIETYRQQIMNKLNRYTIAELTKYAIKEGLTSIDN